MNTPKQKRPCPKCNGTMVLRKSRFKRNTYWYGCNNWPRCPATIALHPDGTDMSTAVDKETKQLRRIAHDIAAVIWGEWNDPQCKKVEMYNWMRNNTSTGHIGKMGKTELKHIIKLLKRKAYK